MNQGRGSTEVSLRSYDELARKDEFIRKNENEKAIKP